MEARERVLGPEHPDTLNSADNLGYLLNAKDDYAGAEPLFRRALEGLLKISATIGRPHPNLQGCIGHYTACLERQGRSGEEIRQTLESLIHPFRMSSAGGGAQEDAEPPPRLRALIEQVMRDPSRFHEMAEQLQREAPELFMVLLQSMRRGARS